MKVGIRCADSTAELSALSGGRLPVTDGRDSGVLPRAIRPELERDGWRPEPLCTRRARGMSPRGRWRRVLDPGSFAHYEGVAR
jgi:hypothetical protein